MLVVSRWYGGIMLHGDRFKHISNVARDALRVGGFLPEPATPAPKGGAKSIQRRGSNQSIQRRVCISGIFSLKNAQCPEGIITPNPMRRHIRYLPASFS